MIKLVYDGTFPGLLTAVFDTYLYKFKDVRIEAEAAYNPNLFSPEHKIYTDEQKSSRVWEGIKKKVDSHNLGRLYIASFSDEEKDTQHLFDCIRYIIDNPPGVINNLGNLDVLSVEQIARKVLKEAHRLQQFIRFQKTADNMFFAICEPEYNTLPLIKHHFTNRYADQTWLIYDKKRKYGLYYDLRTAQEIQFAEEPKFINQNNIIDEKAADKEEQLYNDLWKNYYRHITIAERKNSKLQKQFMPVKYWKYLIETKPL